MREKNLGLIRRERIQACKVGRCKDRRIVLHGNNDNMELWSRSADRHKGVCLEFVLKENQKDHIFPVEYIANAVSDTPHKMPATLTALQDQFYRKIEETTLIQDAIWKQEREYRIIPDEQVALSERTRTVYNAAWLNLKLSRIYLGLETSQEDRAALLHIAQEINEQRVQHAGKYLSRDRMYTFCMLYCMDQLVSVWEMYNDDKQTLMSRKVDMHLKI